MTMRADASDCRHDLEPSRPTDRLWMAALVVVLAWLALVLCHDIARPWIKRADWNGVVWSQSARNNLRAGFRATLGVPTAHYFGPLPIPEDGYYIHHPPLLPLIVTGVFAVLGEHEWAARLVPIVHSIVGVLLFWFVVRECSGVRIATLSAAMLTVVPMYLHYGSMVNHEPLVLTWVLAGILGLCRWEKSGNKKWLLLLYISMAVGAWISWLTYMLGVPIAALLVWKCGRDGRRAAGILGLIALSSLVLFFVHVALVRSDILTDLYTAVSFRASLTDEHSHAQAWSKWFTMIRWTIGHHFPRILRVMTIAGFVVLMRRDIRNLGSPRRASTWALVFGAFNAVYVLVFPNASYIHGYACFFFVVPCAIMSGVVLDSLIHVVEKRIAGRAWRVALVVLCTIATVTPLAWLGLLRTRELDRAHQCLLDWQVEESRQLTPDLGRAIGNACDEKTVFLCNFLYNYSPHLQYYAQRVLANDLRTSEHWLKVLDETTEPVMGVIWRAAPGVEELLQELPPGQTQAVTISGISFLFWHPQPAGTEGTNRVSSAVLPYP